MDLAVCCVQLLLHNHCFVPAHCLIMLGFASKGCKVARTDSGPGNVTETPRSGLSPAPSATPPHIHGGSFSAFLGPLWCLPAGL